MRPFTEPSPVNFAAWLLFLLLPPFSLGATPPPLPSIKVHFPSADAIISPYASLHLKLLNAYPSSVPEICVYASYESSPSEDHWGCFLDSSFVCKDECLRDAVGRFVKEGLLMSDAKTVGIESSVGITEEASAWVAKLGEGEFKMDDIVNFVAAPELILNLDEPLRPGLHRVRATLSLRGRVVVDEDEVVFRVVEEEGSVWESDNDDDDEGERGSCAPLTEFFREGVEAAISFAESEHYRSQLPESRFKLEGMSGGRFRAFMNKLVEAVGTSVTINYLEIGVYKGATFLSTLHGNLAAVGTATAIDNWSLFGGPKDEMIGEVRTFMEAEDSAHSGKIRIVEGDAFNLEEKETIWGDNSLSKVNLYFFDGPHR